MTTGPRGAPFLLPQPAGAGGDEKGAPQGPLRVVRCAVQGRAIVITGEVQVSQSLATLSSPSAFSTDILTT